MLVYIFRLFLINWFKKEEDLIPQCKVFVRISVFFYFLKWSDYLSITGPNIMNIDPFNHDIFASSNQITREGVREKSAVLLFWSDRRENKRVQNSTCGSRHILIIPWMRAIHRRGEPSDLITEYESRALVSSNQTQCKCWSFYVGMGSQLDFFVRKVCSVYM